MYAVGSSDTEPYLDSQEEAAERWFQTASYIPGGVNRCKRYYFERTNSGPYRDMKWENGSFSVCEWQDVGINVKENGIAATVICTPTSPQTRCHANRHLATSENLGGGSCSATDSSGPIGRPSVGNPIFPTTGNKFQAEPDFTVPGSPWLNLTRYYNSSSFTHNGVFGLRTRHSLEYALKQGSQGIELVRPDGAVLSFNSALQPAPGVLGYLVQDKDAAGSPTGWRYDDDQGQVEAYDLQGRIVRVDFMRGGHIAYGYNDGVDENNQLTYASSAGTVTDHFGRTVAFAFNADGLVSSVTTPSGQVYSYTYFGGNRMEQVVRPDGTNRSYGWDGGAGRQGLLLSIRESANGTSQPYASFNYDYRGWATGTQHHGSVESFSVAYTADGTPTVTTPTGAKIAYGVQTVNGRRVGTTTSTTCSGSACGQTTASEFDAAGNLSSLTDEAGSRTCMAYNNRNLLIKKVQGLSASAACSQALANPPATSITTAIQWHPEIRQPAVTTGPNKRVAYTFDSAYRVTSVTETATSDNTGAQGLNATATGAPRTSTFAYNAAGQVTSVDGPRTDVNDITLFAYDASGNLATETNPAGHVTTFSDYDGDGRARRIVAPNGAETTRVFNARGQLTSETFEGETTTYTYYGNGLPKTVSSPNGQVLTYWYDGAMRQTEVANQWGERLGTGYNSASVVTSQSVKGSSGSYVYTQWSAFFDTMSRMTRLTGIPFNPFGSLLTP